MKLKIRGFEWDDGNIHKCQKHGVSLDTIEGVFFVDDILVMPDIRHSKTEDRLIAVANVNKRYVFVVFVERNGLIRPVSARFMHKYEVEYYEQEAGN